MMIAACGRVDGVSWARDYNAKNINSIFYDIDIFSNVKLNQKVFV
jgi:hypothetical protein